MQTQRSVCSAIKFSFTVDHSRQLQPKPQPGKYYATNIKRSSLQFLRDVLTAVIWRTPQTATQFPINSVTKKFGPDSKLQQPIWVENQAESIQCLPGS